MYSFHGIVKGETSCREYSYDFVEVILPNKGDKIFLDRQMHNISVTATLGDEVTSLWFGN